jgi:hypothetical protein
LHYKPARDQNGKPIYEAENKVKLIRDVLPNSFHYFDDIICGSEPRETYKMTLDFHFACLEKIVERLSFHGAKMNVGKSTFAKPKILFLGWVVSHDFITPDPRRMEKIKKAKFPTTKKEVRAFIGLVNSIRRVVPLEILKEVQILTPLTSSSKTVLFERNKKHFEAFEKIKIETNFGAFILQFNSTRGNKVPLGRCCILIRMLRRSTCTKNIWRKGKNCTDLYKS